MIIKWDITKKCNLRCKFCLNAFDRKGWEEDCTTEEVKSILDKLFLVKEIGSLTFLGGEPTARKDFLDITDYIAANSKLRFTVVTNAVRIARPEYERLLKNPNLVGFTVSVDGPDVRFVEPIRGKNVFPKIIAGLEKMNQFRKENHLAYEIHINTVLTQKNYKYIEEMISFSQNYGCNELSFLGYVNEGSGANACDELQMNIMQDIEAHQKIGTLFTHHKEKWDSQNFRINPNFASSLSEDYVKNILKLDFPRSGHACGLGIKMVYINNKGEFYPCDRTTPFFRLSKELNLSIKRPSLLKHDFLKVFNSDVFKKTYSYITDRKVFKNYHPCYECKHLLRKCFPCGIYSIDQDKHYIHENCQHYLKELRKAKIDMDVPVHTIPEGSFAKAKSSVDIRNISEKETFIIDDGVRLLKTDQWTKLCAPIGRYECYLNPTGYYVLDLLKTAHSFEELLSKVYQRYNMTPESNPDIKKDINDLLSFYESRFIVRPLVTNQI